MKLFLLTRLIYYVTVKLLKKLYSNLKEVLMLINYRSKRKIWGVVRRLPASLHTGSHIAEGGYGHTDGGNCAGRGHRDH